MRELKRRINSASGFTLIELLLVIVIIGVLSGVLIAVINPAQARRRAQEVVLRGNTDKLCLATQACAAARSDAATACYDATRSTWLSEIGANDPNGNPSGATFYSTYAGTTITVGGSWPGSTCVFNCTYDTSSGAATKTAPVTPANCLVE